MWAELKTIISDLRSSVESKPELRWGRITAADPLTLKLDADSDALHGTPATVLDGLTSGDRVLTVIQNRKVTVIGKVPVKKPKPSTDTGWHNLKLARGWKTVTGHTPRARVRNGTLFVEGAARREAGGSLTHIATLPAQVLSKVTGSKDSFVGTFSALKAGGGHAHGELYLTTSSGVIGTGDYTTLDPYAGWVVPLTFTISADQ